MVTVAELLDQAKVSYMRYSPAKALPVYLTLGQQLIGTLLNHLFSGTRRHTTQIECHAKMDGRKRKNLEDGQADPQKVR